MLCVPVGPLQANCYLIWDEDRRACAVDPGGEPERLARLLTEKDLSLEAIFVTHGHFDHAEGVAALSGGQGCSATGLPLPVMEEKHVILVADMSAVVVGALSVKVIATPGHTPGDVTYDIDGSLFCGDLLFRGSVGRTDFPGGDFGTLIDSIRRLVESYPAETRVYPGHMEATSLVRELKDNPFLAELRQNG
jgi:hydroxyacylglutathione hydrolase